MANFIKNKTIKTLLTSVTFFLVAAPMSAAEAPSVSASMIDADSIQSGDKLDIQVFREKDLSGSFTVNPTGKINYPFLGEIYVEGLRLEELKGFLVEELGKEYLVDPQIQIIFEESPNKSVAILGQVTRPGSYILVPNLTLVRLLTQVGGFAVDAATDDVRVVRTDRSGKKTNLRMNVQSYMKGQGEDLLLMPGDVVYVDRSREELKKKEEAALESVSILGQVARPGNYHFTKGMTIVKLVSEAGGFTALAAPNKVKLVRKGGDGNKKQAMFVNMGLVMDGRADDIPLQVDDLIVVPESFF